MNMNKISLLIAAAGSLFLTTQAAEALDLTIDPSDFTQNSSGVVNNNASNTESINTGTPTAGFGNFFTSNYLLLGADSTDTITDGNNADTNSSIRSNTTFTLSGTQRIAVEFDWAFQGDSTGLTGDIDSFNLRLLSINPLTNAVLSSRQLFSNSAAAGYGSKVNQIAVALGNSYPAGTYRLGFTLNENDSTGTNSAAGFDNISVYAVPFEFSPAQGLLAVGGIWGISAYLKRKKAAATLSNDISLS
jgi:hypothetical protein